MEAPSFNGKLVHTLSSSQRIEKVLPHYLQAQTSYEEACSRAYECLHKACFTTRTSNKKYTLETMARRKKKLIVIEEELSSYIVER